jgi:hypothetical protein
MDQPLACPKCKVKLATFADKSMDFHLPVHIDVDKANRLYSLRCPVCATPSRIDALGTYFPSNNGPVPPTTGGR